MGLLTKEDHWLYPCILDWRSICFSITDPQFAKIALVPTVHATSDSGCAPHALESTSKGATVTMKAPNPVAISSVP